MQNRDVFRDDILSFALVGELCSLSLVSCSIAIEIKPILEKRKLLKSEHTNAIQAIIKQLYSAERSEKLMTQFVHGFVGHSQNLLVLVSIQPEDAADGDLGILGLNKMQRLWLRNELMRLKDLLNDFVANYNPTQLLLAKMDNFIGPISRENP